MYYGSSGDRYREYIDDSTSHKIKSAYWSTRQAVIRKLGKEEDKHIVASDSELDSKLDVRVHLSEFMRFFSFLNQFRIHVMTLAIVSMNICVVSLVNLLRYL